MSVDELLVEVTREQAQGKAIKFFKGSSAANFTLPPDDAYNQWQRNSYDWVLENVINRMVKRGEIDDGSRTPHDDRKLRYDGVILRKSAIEIPAGLTHFYAYQDDLTRSAGENDARRRMGISHFNDPFAYFSCPIGVEVVPVTLDGSVIIGPRKSQRIYPGYWQAAGGHIICSNFQQPEKTDVQNDVRRELMEEYGVAENFIKGSPELLGIARHGYNGDMAICFMVNVGVPDSFFTLGEYRRFVPEPEHTNLFPVSSINGIQEILAIQKVVFPTRLALQSLKAEDLRN